MTKLERNNEARRQRFARLRELSLCRECKLASIGGTGVRCESCQLKRRIQNQEYEKTKKIKNQCLYCKASATVKAVCELCYCKRVAISRLGIGKFGKDLLIKLNNQEYKCPYTGNKLVLGENAALDHKLPVSRFPDRAKDIENVEWTTREVNLAKNNRTPEEFIKFIESIKTYRNLSNC